MSSSHPAALLISVDARQNPRKPEVWVAEAPTIRLTWHIAPKRGSEARIQEKRRQAFVGHLLEPAQFCFKLRFGIFLFEAMK